MLHKRGDKRNLETPTRCVDDKPVLGATSDQIGDVTHSIAGIVPHLETDKLIGPILLGTQFTALGGNHVVTPDRFSGNPCIDAYEFEMMAAIGTANRSHFKLSALDEYRFAWFEMDQVILVHVEADVSVEAVGPTQAPDDETGLSR